MKFIWFGLLPIGIIAVIFMPAPRNIKEPLSTEQIEEKIKKSMKYDKCIEDVESEVNTLLSYSKSIAYSDPEGAKVVLDEAKYALEKGEKKCKEDSNYVLHFYRGL